MLNNYTVRTRLAVLALLPVTVFVITSIFTMSIMSGMVKGIDSLYDDRVIPLEQIKTQLALLIYSINTALSKFQKLTFYPPLKMQKMLLIANGKAT